MHRKTNRVLAVMLAAGLIAATLSGCLDDTDGTGSTEQTSSAPAAAAGSERGDIGSLEPAGETGTAAGSTIQAAETGSAADSTSADSGEGLTFSTVDLDGNEVTDDIFRNKKLTVINIWGTFCGPCVNELPELESWSEEMPDDVQIIGLVGDVNGVDDSGQIQTAQDILAQTGVKYTNIVPNSDLSDLMGTIYAYPTTIFVDSTGNIVGDPIVGADVDGYRSFVENYLNR
jgi:thiol-disulfide isomerase/thioredoxin